MEAPLAGAQPLAGHDRDRIRPALGQQDGDVGARGQSDIRSDRPAAADQDGRAAAALDHMAGCDPAALARD
jgi:hypothetical protein